MICISNIYYKGKRVSHYVVNANIFQEVQDKISDLYFDLVDIEANIVKQHVDFRDIIDFYDEIFGVYNFWGRN